MNALEMGLVPRTPLCLGARHTSEAAEAILDLCSSSAICALSGCGETLDHSGWAESEVKGGPGRK